MNISYQNALCSHLDLESNNYFTQSSAVCLSLFTRNYHPTDVLEFGSQVTGLPNYYIRFQIRPDPDFGATLLKIRLFGKIVRREKANEDDV